MRLFDRYKPEMDKSLMKDAFDNRKKHLRWMIGEDDLWGFNAEHTYIDDTLNWYDRLTSDNRKKEKEEMNKAIPDITKTERISVNYNGATYYVDEGEIEYRTFESTPTVTIKFRPTPGRKIMPPVLRDSSCAKCPPNDFSINKVTFNGPKTIVEWKDGTKTIVNCNEDSYDPEKGLAMAIVKKVFGNKGNYYNTFRKAMEKARYYNQPVVAELDVADMILAALLGRHNEEEKKNDNEG